MPYDVVIVGAGPAGLSTAIRLKQLKPDLAVCVIEKGSEVGRIFCPAPCLNRVPSMSSFPDWKEKGAPLTVPAVEDHFLFLTENSSFRLPTPPQMHNKGNYIISLGVSPNGWPHRLKHWASKFIPALPLRKSSTMTAAP